MEEDINEVLKSAEQIGYIVGKYGTQKEKDLLIVLLSDWQEVRVKNKELLEKVNYLEEIRANQTYENEELEKMVEEMASFIEVAELDEDIAKTYCKNEACTEINKFNCQKCIIDYFRKKAKGE